VAGKGVKDACSEWKKQQTQGVLKVVRWMRDRKGRLSAKAKVGGG
jgi:hypothetical protein